MRLSFNCVIHRHPFNEVVKIFEVRGVYGSRDSEKTTVGQTYEQAGNAGITCPRCGFLNLHSDNGGAGTSLLELKGSGLLADVHDLHLTKRYLP